MAKELRLFPAETMARCSRCGQTKPVAEFTWNRVKQRPDTYCKPCRAAYGRDHYEQNKELYISKNAKRKERLLEERYRYLRRFFADNPCVDCGESDPLVLEFDHVRGAKKFHISHALSDRAWGEILAEIAKCEVRCANCHRRKTAREWRFRRALFNEESG